MKSTFTNLMILVAAVSLMCVFAGCEAENKLAQCQENTAQLQEKLDAKEVKIANLKHREASCGTALMEAIITYEKLNKENKALKNKLSQTKKAKSLTPEEKENVRKGIEEIRRLQQENAIRLQEKAAEKANK